MVKNIGINIIQVNLKIFHHIIGDKLDIPTCLLEIGPSDAICNKSIDIGLHSIFNLL